MRELNTEILDEQKWWRAIHATIETLRDEVVSRVHVEYGFVMDRDFDGLAQGIDKTIALEDLGQLIADGVREKMIEFKGGSDFKFRSEDGKISILLCNDGDIHFSSGVDESLEKLRRRVSALGIAVRKGH